MKKLREKRIPNKYLDYLVVNFKSPKTKYILFYHNNSGKGPYLMLSNLSLNLEDCSKMLSNLRTIKPKIKNIVGPYSLEDEIRGYVHLRGKISIDEIAEHFKKHKKEFKNITIKEAFYSDVPGKYLSK